MSLQDIMKVWSMEYGVYTRKEEKKNWREGHVRYDVGVTVKILFFGNSEKIIIDFASFSPFPRGGSKTARSVTMHKVLVDSKTLHVFWIQSCPY